MAMPGHGGPKTATTCVSLCEKQGAHVGLSHGAQDHDKPAHNSLSVQLPMQPCALQALMSTLHIPP